MTNRLSNWSPLSVPQRLLYKPKPEVAPAPLPESVLVSSSYLYANDRVSVTG